MARNLYASLVDLGVTNPELRPHIRPLLRVALDEGAKSKAVLIGGLDGSDEKDVIKALRYVMDTHPEHRSHAGMIIKAMGVMKQLPSDRHWSVAADINHLLLNLAKKL